MSFRLFGSGRVEIALRGIALAQTQGTPKGFLLRFQWQTLVLAARRNSPGKRKPIAQKP
jgi:hypothetical protein